VAALVAAALTLPAPAIAASGSAPYEAVKVGEVPAKAGAGLAAAAAPYCVLSSSYPSLYDNGSGGLYVVGSGEYRCDKPVQRIDLHIDVYRDNEMILSRDSSAVTRPGFKLYSLLSILGPSCSQAGTYRWDITGWVNNGAAGSGRVLSTPVYFSCAH
jgi:hypothetical protein